MKKSEFNQYANYPPSVLVIVNEGNGSHHLRQWLENTGCHTKEIDPTLVNPITCIHQQYFDLIILDIDSIDPLVSDVIAKLRTDPEFVNIPFVVMSQRDQLKNTFMELIKRPFYYITKDNSAKEILLQIIRQIHYLTYRYALVGYA